jgi:Domain of unknown function (DUF4340)
MNARQSLALVSAAFLVAICAIWVSRRSSPEQSMPANQPVLPSLADSLDSVTEVRLSRGDGTATTLQRRDGGWYVVQRNYPADPGKLRKLLIDLSGLKTIESKTADPAHYAALGVEDSKGAESHSEKIEVVGGKQSWSLLLGKSAEPDGSYVRIAGAAAALSAGPRLEADPQPARWIAPQVLDVAADHVQRVTVRPAEGPSYWLGRDARGATDLTLHGVPAGRKPAGPAMIDGVAGVLARLNADDVKERSSAALEHPSQASFRTFDGLQLDLEGYRDGSATWIRVHASEDPETARRFAVKQPASPQAKAPAAAAPAVKTAEAKDGVVVSAQAKSSGTTGTEPSAPSPDAAAEAAAINARAQAFDFQIPSYQYDQIFRPLKDLLAPLPTPPTTAATKTRK